MLDIVGSVCSYEYSGIAYNKSILWPVDCKIVLDELGSNLIQESNLAGEAQVLRIHNSKS